MDARSGLPAMGGAYGSVDTFNPSVIKGDARRMRQFAQMIVGFAAAVAVICVAYSSTGPSISVPGVSKLAGAPSRGTSILASTEMSQANQMAGFDLTSLLQTTELENSISNTKLCQKRDKIIDLFEQLLQRLVDEQGIQQTKYDDLVALHKSQYNAYVDAVAAKETAAKQESDAKKVLDLAINDATAATKTYTAAKKNYDDALAPFKVEYDGINEDIELIKELLSMIETLHATPSSGAVGYSPEEARAMNEARLQQNIAKIQQLSARINSKRARALSTQLSTQKLAEYEESSSVKKIILELLQDILDRKAFIENEVKDFKEQMDAAKAVKDAKDTIVADASETHSVAAETLARYSGNYIPDLQATYLSTEVEYQEQKVMQEKSAVQFERERFVIAQIKLKLNSYCDETEDTSQDVRHMSCADPDTQFRNPSDVCMCKPGYKGPTEGPCVKCEGDNHWCFGDAEGYCAEGATLSEDRSSCNCNQGYSGPTNGDTCTKCEADQLCPGGDIAPGDCPRGKTSNADHTACVYKPGYYAITNAGPTSDGERCPANSACPGGEAGAVITCSDNAMPNSDSTACKCNAGFTGPNNGACAACPANNACPGGDAQPQTCQPNSVPASPLAINCECKEGFFLDGTDCSPCPDGQFCVGGTASPGQCPANSNSHEGGHKCVCQPGFFGDNAECESCTQGYTCEGGDAAPVKCTGEGRTVRNNQCVCGEDFKEMINGKCKKRSYQELVDAGVTVPACDDVSPSEKSVVVNNAGMGNKVRLFPGKWFIKDGMCINSGERTNRPRSEDPCVIVNCDWNDNKGVASINPKEGAKFVAWHGRYWSQQNSGQKNSFWGAAGKVNDKCNNKCDKWGDKGAIKSIDVW